MQPTSQPPLPQPVHRGRRVTDGDVRVWRGAIAALLLLAAAAVFLGSATLALVDGRGFVVGGLAGPWWPPLLLALVLLFWLRLARLAAWAGRAVWRWAWHR